VIALAVGGVVTSPTLARIGEKGPEAVVPLSQAQYGAFASPFLKPAAAPTSSTITVNVSVDAKGAIVPDKQSFDKLARYIVPAVVAEVRRVGRSR
jgi:hypothetical protein